MSDYDCFTPIIVDALIKPSIAQYFSDSRKSWYRQRREQESIDRRNRKSTNTFGGLPLPVWAALFC